MKAKEKVVTLRKILNEIKEGIKSFEKYIERLEKNPMRAGLVNSFDKPAKDFKDIFRGLDQDFFKSATLFRISALENGKSKGAKNGKSKKAKVIDFKKKITKKKGAKNGTKRNKK